MAFRNPNNNPENKKAKAVDYINGPNISTFANSDSIPEDQWKELQALLFHGNQSIVISQIKDIYRKHGSIRPEKLQELVCIFSELFSECRFFLNYKLKYYFRNTANPGNEFLQWLLDFALMHIVREYERKSHRVDRLFIYHDDIDENGSDSLEAKTNEEDAVRQKLNRYKEICKKRLVQFVLRFIAKELTKKTNWQTKVKFNQIGLQMYPFLQSHDIELDSNVFDICKQLKDSVENYVREAHQGQSDFNEADYLTEKHNLAQKRIAEKRKQLEALFKTARPNSYNRSFVARQLLKLIEEEWLAPLDNEMISEICKIRLQYADQILFRYRDVYLSKIYNKFE